MVLRGQPVVGLADFRRQQLLQQVDESVRLRPRSDAAGVWRHLLPRQRGAVHVAGGAEAQDHADRSLTSSAASAGSISPLASTLRPRLRIDSINGPSELAQTTWTYTATNKLLIQAGASFLDTYDKRPRTGGYALTKNPFTAGGTVVSPGPNTFRSPSSPPATDGARGGKRRASYAEYDNPNFNQRVSASYVTGSHAAKVGLQTYQGTGDRYGMLQPDNSQLDYRFSAGVPSALTQWAGPLLSARADEVRRPVRAGPVDDQAADTQPRRAIRPLLGVHPGSVMSPPDRSLARARCRRLRDVPNFKDVTPRLRRRV